MRPREDRAAPVSQSVNETEGRQGCPCQSVSQRPREDRAAPVSQSVSDRGKTELPLSVSQSLRPRKAGLPLSVSQSMRPREDRAAQVRQSVSKTEGRQGCPCQQPPLTPFVQPRHVSRRLAGQTAHSKHLHLPNRLLPRHARETSQAGIRLSPEGRQGPSQQRQWDAVAV